MILNKANGKIYIGQSIDYKRRLKHHKNALMRNAHHNQHLQSSWNKYGKSVFEFALLEPCSVENLDESEVWWIDFFDSTNDKKGYNLENGGSSNYNCSESTKQKIGNSQKGSKHSFNHKLKTSKSLSSTGLFRVTKHYSSNYTQGYYWRYQYYVNGKRKVISSIDLEKLKEKVISQGLEWYDISEDRGVL